MFEKCIVLQYMVVVLYLVEVGCGLALSSSLEVTHVHELEGVHEACVGALVAHVQRQGRYSVGTVNSHRLASTGSSTDNGKLSCAVGLHCRQIA